MAQIRKFQDGGNTPSLFDVDGMKINKNDFLYLAKKNLPILLSNNQIQGDDEISVTSAYNNILKGIEENDISSIDRDGNYVSKSGKILNGEDGNNSQKIAGQLLNQIAYKMKPSANAVKKKFEDTKEIFGEKLNNKLFGGNYTGTQADILHWLNQDKANDKGVRARTNRMKLTSDWLEEIKNELPDLNYENSPFTDRQAQEKALQNAIDLGRKGKYNDAYKQALLNTGYFTVNHLDTYFSDKDPEIAQEQTTQTNPSDIREQWIKQKINEELQTNPGLDQNILRQKYEMQYDKSLEESNKKNQEEINLMNYKSWFDKTTEGFQGQDYDITLNGGNYNLNWYDPSVTGKKFNNNWIYAYENAMQRSGNITFLQLFNINSQPYQRRQLRAILELDAKQALKGKSPYLEHLGNNIFLLKNYVNYSKGYAWIYDMNKASLRKIKTSDIEELAIRNKKWYETEGITSHKKGGILFAKQGYYLQGVFDQQIKDYNSNKQKKEVEEAKKQGKTPEQVKAANRKPTEDFSLVDIARLGSVGLDITSAISANGVGYGTVLSAATGTGSSLLSFGADVAEDGLDWNDAKRLGINLAADAVGLIPGFGATAKGGKIATVLIKYAPKLIRYATYASNIPAIANAIPSLQKLTKGESLTVDDYKNIGYVITSLVASKRAHAGNKRANDYLKNGTKTTSVKVKTKSGNEVILSGNDAEEFKKMSKQDQDEWIKLDHNEEVNRAWWKPNPVQETVDLSFPSLTNPNKHWGSNDRFYQSLMNKTSFELPSFNWKYGFKSRFKNGGRLEFILSHKKGGILKAFGGTSIPTWEQMREEQEKEQRQGQRWGYGWGNRYAPTFIHSNQKTVPENLPKLNNKNTANSKEILNTTSTHSKGDPNDTIDMMNKYLSEKGRLTSDMQHYADSYDDINKYIQDYNNDINTVNQSWKQRDIKVPLNDNANYGETGWTKHNQAHQRLYQSLNDPFTGEIKYDPKQEDILGTSTAHRVADNYNQDFEELNFFDRQNRIHKIKIGGKEYEVYKKKDGTIDLLSNLNARLQQEYEQKVAAEKASKIQKPNNSINNYNLDQTNPYVAKQNLQELGIWGLKTADLLANNRLADELLDLKIQERPILKVANSKVAPVADVYNILASGQQQAGIIENEGRRIQNSTSSLEKGILARLATARSAAQARQKMDLAADEKRQTYNDKEVEVQNYNREQEIETGNQNNAMITNKYNQDLQAKAATKSTKQTNNSLFVGDAVNYLGQKLGQTEVKKQEWDQSYESQVATALKQRYINKARNDNRYLQAYKDAQVAAQNQNKEQLALAQQKMKDIENEYYYKYYNHLQNIISRVKGTSNIGIPELKTLNTKGPDGKYLFAKGGTLRDNVFKANLSDTKRFDKGTLEMIKYNKKAINDSTVITKAILDKLMSKF